MNFDELALELHKKYKGKITVELRDNDELTREKLSAYYTPGVAAVSKAIVENPENLKEYTWTNNLVAVISDGSSVLGLGNIGPKASMPVMEGKSLLFNHFADIDSVPITLDVHSPDEIVATIKAIAPSFGAINLEDIGAPQCFEIEERLKKELEIPVFHDDQHGTAIVVLAGLINAMKVTGRELRDAKIVVSGVGAAGTAIIKLLSKYAQPRIFAVDSKGVISANRTDLNEHKKEILKYSNLSGIDGSLSDIIQGADIFIGVSRAGLVTKEMVGSMDKDPIIFALANPTPEIMPDEAKAAGAAIIATGRSDMPNQVNNALAFPGIFRGALDNGVKQITDEHKLAAAKVIAELVERPTTDEIIPSVMDDRLVPSIAKVIV
ncbi:NADP-dependent malic enzyme [Candidatus Saccharibacteria bacterium]|nr:NADP-dependent malic enzyme [Candidatus Saccharibacteria bacterium]